MFLPLEGSNTIILTLSAAGVIRAKAVQELVVVTETKTGGTSHCCHTFSQVTDPHNRTRHGTSVYMI